MKVKYCINYAQRKIHYKCYVNEIQSQNNIIVIDNNGIIDEETLLSEKKQNYNTFIVTQTSLIETNEKSAQIIEQNIFTPLLCFNMNYNQSYLHIITDYYGLIPLILYYEEETSSLIISNYKPSQVRDYNIQFLDYGSIYIYLNPESANYLSSIECKRMNTKYSIVKHPIATVTLINLAKQLFEALKTYFQKIKEIQEDIVILFSGGIDSVLLLLAALSANIKVVTVTITFILKPDDQSIQNSDLDVSKEILKYINSQYPQHAIESHFIFISQGQYKQNIQNIKTIIFPISPTIMHINISQVLYFIGLYVSQQIKKSTYVSGLGPDEFYCGYHRNKNKFDCDTAIKAGEDIHFRNVQRDYFISQHAGINTVCFPYLEDKNIQQIIYQSYTCLENEDLEDKKLIREAVRLQNMIPDRHIQRPKKAMQFGSGASKILGKVDGEIK